MIHHSQLCLIVLAAFTLIAVPVGLGCDSGGGKTTDGEAIRNLDQFELDEYYTLWQGDLALDGLGSLTISQQDWDSLVSAYRESGLAGMTAEDRRTILLGAIKAYLLSVQSTERSLEVEGGGRSDIVETYQEDSGLFALLRGREERASGILSNWGDTVIREPGSHHTVEQLEVNGDEPTLKHWVERNGAFACEGAASEGVSFLQADYYVRLTAIVDAEPAGRESIGDRETFVVESPYGVGMRRVLLDSDTLFPIRYESPASFDGSGEEIQPETTVTIRSLNYSGPVMEPDVPCDAVDA